MSLHNRLAAVARMLDPVPPEPTMMVLTGFLPDEELEDDKTYALVGKLKLEQAVDETSEGFHKRAMDEARMAGETIVRVLQPHPEDCSN